MNYCTVVTNCSGHYIEKLLRFFASETWLKLALVRLSLLLSLLNIVIIIVHRTKCHCRSCRSTQRIYKLDVLINAVISNRYRRGNCRAVVGLEFHEGLNVHHTIIVNRSQLGTHR